jgi:hypothetical protein
VRQDPAAVLGRAVAVGHVLGAAAGLRETDRLREVIGERRPAGRWWICERAFADFRDESGWTVLETDPNAWPYDGPTPVHRPTAADYSPPDGCYRGPSRFRLSRSQ